MLWNESIRWIWHERQKTHSFVRWFVDKTKQKHKKKNIYKNPWFLWQNCNSINEKCQLSLLFVLKIRSMEFGIGSEAIEISRVSSFFALEIAFIWSDKLLSKLFETISNDRYLSSIIMKQSKCIQKSIEKHRISWNHVQKRHKIEPLSLSHSFEMSLAL